MNGPQQCMSGGNIMRYVTHEDDANIPEGFAALYMDNNGWVGTNNGWPHAGQPALYPLAQAQALCAAWYCALKDIPEKICHPGCYDKEVQDWLRWSPEDVATREQENG